jgi:hypothetical protein
MVATTWFVFCQPTVVLNGAPGGHAICLLGVSLLRLDPFLPGNQVEGIGYYLLLHCRVLVVDSM